MIKKYTLSFSSLELEQCYKQWIVDCHRIIYETTVAALSIYLVIHLANYNGNIIYLIATAIALCVELTILFFLRKYPLQREYIKGFNLIAISVLLEIYIQLNLNLNNHLEGEMIKICMYLQGNRFIPQTFIYVSSWGTRIVLASNQVIPILITVLLTLFSVFFRYHLELQKRKHYLAFRSQRLHENLIEEQIPAWIVLIKYDKQQAQLKIDKINQNMKQTFDINSDQRFREFLRDSNIQPLEQINQKAFNFEDLLTKELLQKQENDKYNKFIGKFINNEKTWQFTITKIYFKTLEPTILLLFVEQSGNLYDFFHHQLYWRDQQLINHSKMSLNYIREQINLLKYLKLSANNQVLQTVNEKISNGYLLFNQSLNILNLTKIIYNKMKYVVNEFSIIDLTQQLKDDLKFSNKQFQTNLIVNTDKSKLISIILSVSEFIRLMLTIQTNDEKQLYSLHPMGCSIKIKFKRNRDNPEFLEVVMEHPFLSIPKEIQQEIKKSTSFTDHKQRNWGVNHYYETIQNLSDQFHRMNVTTKKVTQSHVPYMESEYQLQQQQKIGPYLDGNTEPFSTLGLPVAQYLVSQIGPYNRIQFEDKFYPCTEHVSFRNNQFKTKIRFLIYENLNHFIGQLNQQDPNPYLDFFISTNHKQSNGYSPNGRSGTTTVLISGKFH